MSFRILWHEGWPYPVTGHPVRHDVEDTHWYVQTRDGTWQPIVRREARASLADVWEALEPVVRDWLMAHVPRDDRELPPMLVVEVALHAFAGELEDERFLLARTVNTERGQCYIELTMASPSRKFPLPDVVSRAQNRDPALFSVTFRTTDHPRGVHLQFDATEFLETVAQRYLRHRPTETPISQPRQRDQ